VPIRTLFRVLVVSAVGVLVAAQGAAAQTNFSNSTPIVIPDQGPATPYPSPINVSGLSAAVTDVDVTLNNVTHTFADDIDALLVGPQGQKVILMSDAGDGNTAGITDTTLTFDDSAAASIPDDAPPAPGAYKPTDIVEPGEENDTFTPPAPAGPYSTQLAAFNGTNPNGTWSLYVFDDATLDSGDIEGWSLRIAVAPPTTAAPTISGNAVNHQTLTANAGATTGGSSTSFQWLRCDATGGCVPIPGATGTTYTLTEADIGRAIRVRQTVTGSGGTASADSAPTSAVAPDPSRCSNVFTGTGGNDRINGTTGGDRISGLGGADILSGAARDDCLSGGGGNDRMQGNAGADTLAGSAGRDRMVGGPGRDNHSGGGGNDRIDAGPGNDRETGGGGRDTMSGGPGNDRMSGGAGNDKMNGNGGRNRLSGGAGNDRIAAVNGRRETVNCGAGRRDVARVDRNDRTRGCEVVRRTRR
jgi:Ca2+-binding RTX toxin-like protein